MTFGDKIAVWFSCGAASAVAAKLTLEKYPAQNVIVVNNPVVEEDADNRRFLRDVAAWLGVDISEARNSRWPASSAEDVWRQERFMSSPQGAVCTRALKKEARQQWEREHHPDWHVLGFTADERGRHERFVKYERANVLPVLIDAGLTKPDCARILREAGLELPRVYAMGYPNANCIGCVKATSATYWNLVREMHPAVFESRAVQSRALGVRLARHKGRRVYLDELPADAKGRPLKSMKTECGIFCEEKPK
jgi:3'-phosphoadenosine 5'-phosphosulfate sulfotransferase (PAPS reductase)/FAD synthetase